jgi:DNA-binding NarL/FixJ family response regulator
VPSDAFYQNYDLTKREQEIILLILTGLSNKDICVKSFISLTTVKTHIYNIFRKLGINSRKELIGIIKNYR